MAGPSPMRFSMRDERGLLFDAHAHPQDPRFGDGSLPRLKAIAHEAGICGCCACATNPDDWDATLALPAKFGDGFSVTVALGVHPWWADAAADGWPERLRELLALNPDALVGEVGLDGMRDIPFETQCAVLETQLAIAAELGRGVALHGARAWGKLAELLRPFAGRIPFFIAHGFGGSVETMRELIGLGAYISFGGALCNPSATRVHAAFEACPRDRLLIETDAPDMMPKNGAPFFADGKSGAPLNGPQNLPMIAAAAS